ncbi:polyprenyl synthetase [Halomicrobium sp. LC1Hm]|uniref:polyprenyl synthetase n=1 Tax=Halomicrobium sp. LC1Hm TaxID=2610902 RepID=UPI0012983353|nr:polyprenyl synthetase [Halomicrobium sp. LC1Hm]QGA82167.1 Geranylgeranyl pyrophosphate synthase [Halomicrobium sp. LC1Hm]
MAEGRVPTDHGAEIERRLADLVDAHDDHLPSRVSPVLDDRWYGELLVGSYASVADEPTAETALSGAVAVELLREYCLRRGNLLGHLSDDDPGAGERTASLLAGDFLFSAAYSELLTVDDGRCRDCVETMLDASQRIVETFADDATAQSARSVIEDTAGALGGGAAAVGATIGGIDDRSRDRLESFGRNLAAGRAARWTLALDADCGLGWHVDHHGLARYAEERLALADRQCRALAPLAETARLRPAFEAIEDGPTRTRP